MALTELYKPYPLGKDLLIRQMQTDISLQPICLHSRAYRFFPKREEEKSSFDKKGTRYYFLGQIQHDQYQLRKLKQFHEYVQKKGKPYSKQMFPNDHAILLLLASNKYKPKETLKAMEEYCEFRLIKVPSLVKQKLEGLLKTGFYYVCGRDNFFRPIIVFRIKLIDQSKLDLATDAMIFAMEQICNKMLIPGQVQNWNFIYDLAGINNMLDLPMMAIKKIVTSLQMLYSFKLWRSFVLNAPSSISMFFKLASAFIDDATVEKTKISKESTDKSLFENIHLSQIQQKYGGTQPNRVEYYPFTVPKAVYNENRLMSDQQYQKLLKQGKLLRNKIDPVYLDKKQ